MHASYLDKVCANSLLQKKEPQYRQVGDNMVAGFGDWVTTFNQFQYPLPVDFLDNVYKAVSWVFDETNVVYTYETPTGRKNIFHGTMERLFHEVYPYLHMFEKESVSKIVNEKGIYRFLDDVTGNYVTIEKK